MKFLETAKYITQSNEEYFIFVDVISVGLVLISYHVYFYYGNENVS